jgi:N-alpha-acetyltransferase 15/16, NatA auxiliary subunit
LRNKQRKAKKKAELENAQAAKAEKKKEQYNKSRQQQNQDGDPEAPVLDELIPEKLARPEDPLSKAIDFIKPLQLLVSGLIETHLLTFEIYYRKNKLLIMLQALKRAYAIDPNNATLHGCIIRFIKLLDKQLPEANEFVKIVIQRETEKMPVIGKKSVVLNKEFIDKNKDSAEALIAGARVYYDDSPDNKTKAIELLMSCIQLKSCTLKVSVSTCCKLDPKLIF